MRLVISLPTRGRPQQLIETLTRSSAHLALANTVIMVQVDDDDRATVDALAAAPLDSRILVNIAPREDTIAAKWNRALRLPADAYLVSADDAPEATPGFDALLLEAAARFPDGVGMVYGRMANASFSSMVCPTAKLIDKLGHIFPEYFPYWFVDHWTDDIARIIGRISFAEVGTDQSKVGKTMELREPGWWATWFDAAYLMRRQIARRIIDAPDFESPEWSKELLRRHHPLIEYRSRWVNSNVRGQARQLEGWSGLTLKDERYQRVRRRAVAMVPHLLDDYGMEPQEAAAYRAALTPPSSIVNLKQAYA